MSKLTVILPCFNEEPNIGECLESVKWADEIMVVDSGSTDRTVEIARRYTGRILVHKYVNSAAQKNWAIPRAAGEWVMVIDCDERATGELQEEIRRLMAAGPSHDGYYIRRRNYFLGKRIKRCGWERDRVLRLFRRDKGRYADRAVHADVELDGKAGELAGFLEHYTYRSLDQYFEKFGRYTKWGAEDAFKRGTRAGALSLIFRAPLRFLKMYVFQLGFLDGFAGLVLCALAAFSVFAKYARLWALQNGLDDPARTQGMKGER